METIALSLLFQSLEGHRPSEKALLNTGQDRVTLRLPKYPCWACIMIIKRSREFIELVWIVLDVHSLQWFRVRQWIVLRKECYFKKGQVK